MIGLRPWNKVDRPPFMLAYIIRRVLFMIPTLFGIMVINFLVIQAAPGGPVEQVIAQIRGRAVDATARISGQGSEQGQQQRSGPSQTGQSDKYRGARGLDPE